MMSTVNVTTKNNIARLGKKQILGTVNDTKLQGQQSKRYRNNGMPK